MWSDVPSLTGESLQNGYPRCILTFFLAYTVLWHSIWHAFGIYSDILSGILPDICSDILSGIYSDILSGALIWHSIWHLFRHSFWHSLWHVFGSRRGPLHPELAKDMKKMRGPQDSGVGGWGDEGVVPLLKSSDPHLGGIQPAKNTMVI